MSEYPRVGDKVRVTIEGTVTLANDRLSRFFEIDGSDRQFHTLLHKYEIIERAKPQVGDALMGVALHDTVMPLGTVVRLDTGAPTVRRVLTQSGWANVANYGEPGLGRGARYVIEFIPEVSG